MRRVPGYAMFHGGGSRSTATKRIAAVQGRPGERAGHAPDHRSNMADGFAARVREGDSFPNPGGPKQFAPKHLTDNRLSVIV